MGDGRERLIGGIVMVGTKKSLGQHWLKNRMILEKIADLASVGANEASAYDFAEKTEVETCLEIGPGLGTLTSSLLRRFNKVIAVEYDARLAENLPKSFPGKNLEVVNEDILKFDFAKISGRYVVAGNIPYYITSPIIEKLLTVHNLPQRIVLLIQKEVAERILDTRGTVLSLFVKNRARVFPGLIVSREEFTPPPKVDSQVIILEPYDEPKVAEEVFQLIRVGFKTPRKKLVHNLSSLAPREKLHKVFDEIGVNPDARPADLGLEEWEKLYKVLGVV